MKNNFTLTCICLFFFFSLNAQTNYTSKIVNPSFETGDYTGWNWTGRTGGWTTVNTDGDNTKNGQYIAGYWNTTIADVECSQTITGLPNGYYQLKALLTVSNNRSGNERLFVNNGAATTSKLYGTSTNPAYSVKNLTILGNTEQYSFGGNTESASEAGPFYKVSVVSHVTNGTLTIGVRTSGKATANGYDFSYSPSGDVGFFKFDNFTLAEVSSVATLDNITLSTGSLDAAFDAATTTYNATLQPGATTVTPIAFPTVDGVTITGNTPVDVSSGSGSSTITITALDGSTQKTYTINYTVRKFDASAQQANLYTNNFPLSDVTLLDGPFKHARDLNTQTLLKYDVDRLLSPYRKEAGLAAKATSYNGWIGLDGHIGGHYLTALAMNYAATGDTACRNRMNYMVSELKACQDANAINNASWGVGYAGGVPNSKSVWSTFKVGTFTSFHAAWVPWYNLHKTYAGLRDAWLYGGNDTAKTVFLAFCDWGINITSNLTDAQIETMLGIEHGGMNEIFADAYAITNNAKYLTAAKRFSHKVIFNSMSAGVDNLDNKHANTQVPKAVGFQRIAEVSNDASYAKAGSFFWQTITDKRTLALGGNSRKEYFPQASAYSDYVNDVQGPESCNTNNMLKLTEDLFRIHPDAAYADFYEKALFNHILSTQHPDHGGFVYFTSTRPRHYRVYSAPNEAMWCCVGTGMENHCKYGEFIYTHTADTLYLNLFIASQLNWKSKGITIRQETAFPEEEKTTLRIYTTTPTAFTLKVRSPKWVQDSALKIVVNTDTLKVIAQAESYVSINRVWNNNDSVRILLPMHNSIEPLPNVPNYVALMHGPILLSAKTGTEDLAGLIADDSRLAHIASGTLLPLDKAPIIVTESSNAVAANVVAVANVPLNFKYKGVFANSADSSLLLQPFYKVHDARYMMYWLTISQSQYQHMLDSVAAAQKTALDLESRTIDQVAPGEQQPESDHQIHSSNSNTGNYQNEFWRDANGGYISYRLKTAKKTDLSLMVRYWGNEVGARTFNIYVDDSLLVTENISGKWKLNQFENVEYTLPIAMTAGKDTVTVRFQAIDAKNYAGGIFYVRILQPLSVVTPVGLSNFLAQKERNTVSLAWQTANETNAAYFVVERSNNGQQFGEVGKQAAAGNSSSIKNYNLIDNHPANGSNYYRLKMVDKTGKFTFSKIIYMQFTVNSNQLSAYPNPGKDMVKVFINVVKGGNTRFELYNSVGKRQLSFNKTLKEGNNTFNMGVNQLPKGIYYLKAEGNATISLVVE